MFGYFILIKIINKTNIIKFKISLNSLSLPRTFMVQVVGLEPTLFRTRPLNVRVCHSATLA